MEEKRDRGLSCCFVASGLTFCLTERRFEMTAAVRFIEVVITVAQPTDI